ncbi:MAG: hypothetical protein HKM95_02955 [Inquilinus sp.]|nr:hypothetical protein [Inquilinus sp.]
MVWMKWLPWRFAVSRLARRHGFLDPVALMARLRGFTQPSEVAEPIELLRAGVVMHARGLINSRVIQHNLDWVWPFWVERQFDPGDVSFVPRAFSITHINLTQRNWTAVGLPDCPELPIVDPRGLVTPLYDGWSLDGWIRADDGSELLASRTADARQVLDLADGVAVRTDCAEGGLALSMTARAERDAEGRVHCRVDYRATADRPAAAIVSLRPYNPEGISFVHRVDLSADRRVWTVDGDEAARFDPPVERHHISDYRAGDVHIHLRDLDDQSTGSCDLGMATAAAMFRLEPGRERRITVRTKLTAAATQAHEAGDWPAALTGHCEARLPDAQFQFLYDAAIHTLVLHAWNDVVPGPFTYKRFWFRDAAFIVNGLLAANLIGRAERAIDRFPERQTHAGYFHSQDGEWDSNGQALWIMQRYCALTGTAPKESWVRPIRRAARWIGRKRLSDALPARHAGLLPAGFSAEHLGPNDFYYWDDFWGVAGLDSAAVLLRAAGDAEAAETLKHDSAAFAAAIDRSLSADGERLGRAALPASPYRRLDAGAVGSIVCGYPLQQVAPTDARLMATIEFLLDSCFVDGGFFQDMTHSGINAYLTLHVAQILMRADDPRAFDLLRTVARLASPTGQWPEAIHPGTGGGCMGDGQHVWAAAEWVLAIRNAFLREEADGRLVIAAGLPAAWLAPGEPLRIGPAPTTYGTVSLSIEPGEDRITVTWQARWHGQPPVLDIRLAGHVPLRADAETGRVTVDRADAP